MLDPDVYCNTAIESADAYGTGSALPAPLPPTPPAPSVASTRGRALPAASSTESSHSRRSGAIFDVVSTSPASASSTMLSSLDIVRGSRVAPGGNAGTAGTPT